jgi:hypothetical protein
MWLAAAAAIVASGLLLWLSGAWDLPWSRDGYLRRLGNVGMDWSTDATWVGDALARRQSKLSARLDRLVPPQSFEGEHASLNALRAEGDRLRSDESIEGSSRSVELLREVRELVSRLDARATTDAERRYVAVLNEALGETRSQFVTAAMHAERATEHAIRKFARMRHPASVRTEHAQLVDACRAYLASARAFRAACDAEDPDLVAASALDLERTWQEADAAGTAIFERLEYDACWPAAAGADPP